MIYSTTDPNIGHLAIVAYGVAVIGCTEAEAQDVADDLIRDGYPVPQWRYMEAALRVKVAERMEAALRVKVAERMEALDARPPRRSKIRDVPDAR